MRNDIYIKIPTVVPIFADGSFEFIPIPERYGSSESRTYGTIKGRRGRSLSEFLPGEYFNKTVHYDPEFDTCTYGDPTTKRTRLLKLTHGDLLVFYAGLKPSDNTKYEKALYIIGYFTIDNVVDFDKLSDQEIEKCFHIYHNNAHIPHSALWVLDSAFLQLSI
jgi:hypothetical protein